MFLGINWIGMKFKMPVFCPNDAKNTSKHELITWSSLPCGITALTDETMNDNRIIWIFGMCNRLIN